MGIPRVRASIIKADGSVEIIDRIFETEEAASAEYERLAAFENEAVEGTIIAKKYESVEKIIEVDRTELSVEPVTSITKTGIVKAEICSHFDGSGSCVELLPVVKWGEG